MLTIRELADSCNVSVRTLQYYDQIDLLKPSGYHGRIRLYDETAQKTLKRILAWKLLGLKLEEIEKLQQGAMKQEQLLLLLKQKKEQLMISRDKLLENQRQVDDVLFHIRKCKEWDAADYADILSLQNQERPYSLKTHLLAYLRNMTLLKSIILIFYTLDTICIVALIGAIASFLLS
ncbi:MerR family transcriptional regulator [[Clostridium] innocuum]|nr:MerR family transcriptional regulator [[Clostridium] innocuum]